MTEEKILKAPLWCSSRLALTLVGFFGFINLYALRVDMSVAIVCMTRQEVTNVSGACNVTTGTSLEQVGNYGSNSSQEPDDSCGAVKSGDTFGWDKKTQGLILGSFFWGYIVTQLPGGWLAGRYGGKHVFGWSMLGCAVATLLTPLAARTDLILLMVIRVIAGLCQGVVWPCMSILFSYWAPPLERSKISGFVYAGCQVGVLVTFSLSGLLCVYGFDGGWPSIFYILGGCGVIWFVAWTSIVYDSPVTHPRISQQERDYIVDSLKCHIDVSKKSTDTPWKKIFSSLPVWAIIVTHACANWGTYTFMTNIPTYMKDVLKFDIKKAGFLSSLPYIGFWAVTNISGQLADWMRSKGYITTTTARKLFTCLGTLVPGLFVVITGHLDGHPGIAVAMLTVGVAMSGCQYGSGFMVNSVDIAPRYSGIIFGISKTSATLGGVLAPVIIGIITEDKTSEQWQTVFYIAAVIYTIGAVFYTVFGSGEVQPWALEKKVVLEISATVEKGEIQQSEQRETSTV